MRQKTAPDWLRSRFRDQSAGPRVVSGAEKKEMHDPLIKTSHKGTRYANEAHLRDVSRRFTEFYWVFLGRRKKAKKKTERTNWKPSKRFLTSSTTGQRWRHEQRDRLFVVGFLVSDWIESRPMATRVRAPSFTGFSRTRLTLHVPKGLYWVLLGFTGFYRVVPVLTGFYWVLSGFYWVSLGIIGFHWV